LIEHIERDSIYCDDIFFCETPTDCRIEESSIFSFFEESQKDKICKTFLNK